LSASSAKSPRGIDSKPLNVAASLIANGLLLPFIALQGYVHSLIWIAALWALTSPGATWSLALQFRRAPIIHPPL
jgi:hypothetical protein